MRRTIFIVMLAGSFVLGACATAPTAPDPWQVPRADFEARVQTIAIHGPQVPEDLEDAEAVQEQFERLIARKLKSMGYTVVAARETETIWDSVCDTLGGIYDPATGKRDDAKFEAARKHTLRELETKFDVDAVLHAGIRVVRANFNGGGTAYWCGAAQAMKASGQTALELFLTGPTQGTVPALCLNVIIEDTSGVDLYMDVGGIEVLAILKASGFEQIPREQLFVTHERNQRAIELAFEGFAEEQIAATEH